MICSATCTALTSVLMLVRVKVKIHCIMIDNIYNPQKSIQPFVRSHNGPANGTVHPG